MQYHKTSHNVAQPGSVPAGSATFNGGQLDGAPADGMSHAGKSPAILNRRWFLSSMLVLVIASLNILPRYGFFLEDLQTLAFPLVVFLLWRLAAGTKFKLPLVIIEAALLFWMIGAFNVRAYMPAALVPGGVYLSRLGGEKSDSAGRDLYFRYNQIASVYGLVQMRLIHREISDREQALVWIGRLGQVPLLISGTAEWLTVYVQPRFIPNQSSTLRTLPAELVSDVRELKLEEGRDFRFITVPGTDVVVAMSILPHDFSLPGTPTELARHYLAWFAQGVADEQALLKRRAIVEGRVDSSLSQTALIEQLRLFYLDSAALVDGLWRSSTPRAMALYLKGNLLLYKEFTNAGGLEEVACVRGIFNQAAGLIQKKFTPELYAAVHNNAALVELLGEADTVELKRIGKLLNRAIQTFDNNGRSVASARIALLNLKLLQLQGVL